MAALLHPSLTEHSQSSIQARGMAEPCPPARALPRSCPKARQHDQGSAQSLVERSSGAREREKTMVPI